MRMKPRTKTGNLATSTWPRFTFCAPTSCLTYQAASQRTISGRKSTRVMLKISATLRVSMPWGSKARAAPATWAELRMPVPAQAPNCTGPMPSRWPMVGKMNMQATPQTRMVPMV